MSGPYSRQISLKVNGVHYDREVSVRRTLADVLRHDLSLTGTHIGCEHGVCGACTVLVDGRSIRSCLMFAVQATDTSIVTIEGLASADGALHPLQESLARHHGLQCGFCTPGMLTTLVELLEMNHNPSAEDVRIAISGNLCRCTGYQGIVNAALEAADVLAARRASAR